SSSKGARGAWRRRSAYSDLLKLSSSDAETRTEVDRGDISVEFGKTRAPLIERAPGIALAFFVVAEFVAFGAIMHVTRHQWFFLDEWDFLAGRTAGNLGDLFRPHNDGHWSTLPILAYRANWQLFGLRTYTPYLALTVATHLTIAALLRAV